MVGVPTVVTMVDSWNRRSRSYGTGATFKDYPFRTPIIGPHADVVIVSLVIPYMPYILKGDLIYLKRGPSLKVP